MADNNFTDVDSLFQRQSISEIEGVEKQIRGDIEKKRQDLRVMVGERYRDLINAADTIQDMRKTTGEVSGDIKMISDLCESFNLAKMKERTSPTKKVSKSNEEAFYSLATQMNLLVDTPEKIWSALDTHQYLTAAQYYLLSHHIVNNSLNINASQLKKGSHRDIFASFPILHHQWAAISHFKPSILKGSRNALKDATSPDQAVADSLCCIVLLEDYSPRQVFTEFLTARKTAFQEVFHPSFHATSVKKQVCDVTHMLRLTIQQVISLFYTDESESTSSKPLFYKTFMEVTDEKLIEKGKLFRDLFGAEVDVLTISRYLPPTVSAFVPKLRSIPVSITKSYIQKHTVEWLNSCKKEIQEGVKSLLSFINNIKGLALIRDAVFELLKEIPTTTNDPFLDSVNDEKKEVSLSWGESCHISLNRPLSIWDEVFRPLFFERAKEILQARCNQCFVDVIGSVHGVLEELKDRRNAVTDTCWDHDFTDFMWHDFPHDFSTDAKDPMLSLKVKHSTPSTKRVCDNLNNILKGILEDAKYFISEDSEDDIDQNEQRMRNIKKNVQKLLEDSDQTSASDEPFQKYSDALPIRESLNNFFKSGVEDLCNQIDTILNETKEKLESTSIEDSADVNMQLDRAIYLARLCVSIPDLCVNIRNITEFEEKMPRQSSIRRQLSSNTKESMHKAMKKSASESLQRISTQFSDTGNKGVSIWSSWLSRITSSLVQTTLTTPDDHFVLSTTQWEVVAIDEENDSGEKVKSSVRVPSLPSFHLSSLLYRLSEEVHRAGGGMLDRDCVQCLSLSIATAVLDAHETCLETCKDSKTFQNKIFQMIFDLKFTASLLCGNPELKEEKFVSYRQRVKRFIKTLELLVDPFDLDVFMPHIDTFVKKQLQNSSLLYGCISNVDKHNTQTHRTNTSISEQPNVVPLIVNPPRFLLLPISSHVKDSVNDIEKFVGFDQSMRPLYCHQIQVNISGVA